MDTYIIKINDKYLKGYDYNSTMGKTGASHGHYIEASDMEAIILTDDKEDARLVESVINLKSQLDKITDRMRYAGLEVDRLEIVRVENS